MEPIFLKPVLKDKIWGGDKLKTQFGLEIPTSTTGEAWVISTHPHGVSKVTYPEKYSGLGLDELYTKEPKLFGVDTKEVFPLLIKILDAKEKLSVQVHPNDTYAIKNENDLGKTECWYIISAEKNSKIIYGHNAKNKEDFLNMISNKKWSDLLIEVPVKAGDFFYVPAGTVHAIGEGIVILETQQSSDTTYRLYDYDRKDEKGNTRELHIQKSAEVTSYPGVVKTEIASTKKIGDSFLTHYLTNEYFSVYKLNVKKFLTFNITSKYLLATVIKGSGELVINEKTYTLNLATSFIIPNGISNITFKGDLELIVSNPE